MSKTRQLFVALFLAALFPAASFAQSQGARVDAVSYARSFASGVEQFDAGRYEEALESFHVAVVANPRDAEALFDLGATYEKLGRHTEAAAAYRSALELRPAYAKARVRLCTSLVAARSAPSAQTPNSSSPTGARSPGRGSTTRRPRPTGWQSACGRRQPSTIS